MGLSSSTAAAPEPVAPVANNSANPRINSKKTANASAPELTGGRRSRRTKRTKRTKRSRRHR